MHLMSVSDQSHVSEVRRNAAAIAARAGLNETEQGRLAIIVTEIATNQLKHARGGRVLAAMYEDGSGAGVEVIGFDTGCGIPDLNEAMRDGHSTAGSAGQGLGAIKRQADQFEICSWPDRGTIVFCRVQRRDGSHAPHPSIWGAICIPMAGETACGDDWSISGDANSVSGIVVDGLGHGPIAAIAAKRAIKLALEYKDLPPAAILGQMHAGLSATRGAAASLFHTDFHRVQYAGIGNIAGTVIRADGISRMVSVNGTLGMHSPQIKVFDYPGARDMLIILHTDGISSGWSLDKYPGLIAAHPSIVAAVLFRDFSRNRDDATVLAVRAGVA